MRSLKQLFRCEKIRKDAPMSERNAVGFLSLPREIRDMIYREVLSSSSEEPENSLAVRKWENPEN